MDLKDVLLKANISYDEILTRFSGNEALMKRFLLKFPSDPTFHSLQEQVNARDYEAVERSAHTLKGVSANLGFSRLNSLSAEIVSAVRSGETEKVPALFEEAQREYEIVLHCIREIE